nr:hypothetical protein [Actinomycetota bacterium]
IQASARARAQLEEVDETPEEVRDAVRAILSRAAPPPPPDPITGRVVTPRPSDPGPLTAAQLHRRIMEIAHPGPLTAAQLHRRIMEIARLAGRVPQ